MEIIFLFVLALFTAYFIFEMKHSLQRSEKTNRLIKKYFADQDNPALIDEIYEHCIADFKLKRVMQKHAATKDDLAAAYNKLRVWGNIKKGRRYLPVSSFFYVYTLDWLLSNKDADEKSVAVKMMNFFHF